MKSALPIVAHYDYGNSSDMRVFSRIATGFADIGIMPVSAGFDAYYVDAAEKVCKDLPGYKVAIALAIIRESDLYPSLKSAPLALIKQEHIEQVLSDVRTKTIIDSFDAFVERLRPH